MAVTNAVVAATPDPTFADQVQSVLHAPIPYLATIVAVGALLWFIINWGMNQRYGGQISALKERLSLRDDQLKALSETAVQSARVEVARSSEAIQLGEVLVAEIVSKTADDSGPNMPIRELFFYLDDDVLNAQTENWIRIGRLLLDALSLKKLHAWGRRIGKGGLPSRRRGTLEEMEIRWSTAEFSYFFFPEGHEDVTHVIARDGGPTSAITEWADVQFNRAEVENLWHRGKALHQPSA